MSQLHETFAKPKATNTKAGWIALGVSSVAVVGMLCGPSTWRSYQQGQDIEHKRGPAKAYVTKTLGELVLDGEQLNVTIGDHECDNGPNYAPGDVSRHCKVQGKSTYVIQAKDYSSAYDKASGLLRQHNIKRDEQTTIPYQGQRIEVFADFTLRTGLAYNNSLEHSDIERKAPDTDYVVMYDVEAYTVNFDAPEYLHNDDSSP